MVRQGKISGYVSANAVNPDLNFLSSIIAKLMPPHFRSV